MDATPLQRDRIEEAIRNGEKVDITFEGDRIQELHSMLEIMIEKTHWGRNIEMVNKAEERERFLEKLEQGEKYTPSFEFSDFPHSEEQLIHVLQQCIDAAEGITREELESYGAEEITPRQMQQFYHDIFHELELYTRLGANIEDEEAWKKYSERIWPMVDREEYERSKERMQELETFEEEKDLDSSDLREMFEEEVKRLGMDWDVEVRKVPGCHNIPEERTVVVADGKDEKRYYSREEAEMLTVHELFHSVRAYNGYQASKGDLPPILAIHTPFYDRTEEGGALYRESETGAAYSNKTFDHHLRLVTAYRMAESDDLEEEFHDIAEDIIEVGGEPRRVFDLMARNREAMRHHIYKSGERAWRDAGDDEIRRLLIGKISHEYAEIFGEEVDSGGMIGGPEIGPEKLFDFTFKDSE